MVANVQKKDMAPIRDAILKVLRDCYPSGKKTSEIEYILDSEGYNRSSVATKINKLLQEGTIVGEGHPKTYYLKDQPKQPDANPLAATLNTKAPDNSVKIEPMSDDVWSKEVNRLLKTRPWTHLSFQEIFRMADDVYDDVSSWDVIGKAVVMYCKLLSESIKTPMLQDIPDYIASDEKDKKEVYRAVKHLMSYPFVRSNEEYAYDVINNNWHKNNKDKKAKMNPHYQVLQNRANGIIDDRPLTNN